MGKLWDFTLRANFHMNILKMMFYGQIGSGVRSNTVCDEACLQIEIGFLSRDVPNLAELFRMIAAAKNIDLWLTRTNLQIELDNTLKRENATRLISLPAQHSRNVRQGTQHSDGKIQVGTYIIPTKSSSEGVY